MWPSCLAGRLRPRPPDDFCQPHGACILQIDGSAHIGMDIAMIRIAAGNHKLELEGTTRWNVPTIKCLPIIAGDSMGHRRHVLPDHRSTRPDRQRRRAKAEAATTIINDQHHLCKARQRRRLWRRSLAPAPLPSLPQAASNIIKPGATASRPNQVNLLRPGWQALFAVIVSSF